MEDFITFEIAKRLKDLGFNEPFFFYYREDDKDKYVHHANISKPLIYCDKIDNEVIIAPTIAQVLKWLREVKGIDVLLQRGHINIDNNGKVARYYNVNIYFERRFACTLDNDEQDYSTYGQAALAGIEYVLDNLI